MSLPKEPRQKMINLMYLVLTALLALNVSAEILNAFKTIGESIEKSNSSIEKKNVVIYDQIKRKLKDKASIKPIADRASKLSEYSRSVYDKMNEIKLEILRRAKYDPATGEYDLSNIDIPSRYFLAENNGKVLYDILQKYLDNITGLIDPKDVEAIKSKFALDLKVEQKKNQINEKKSTWEYRFFNMTPVVAATAIIEKFQNDVKNTEASVLEYLFNKIGEDVIVYDKLEPFVSAASDYILLGQQYEANIGVGAISTSVNPIIKVNGTNIRVQGGVGTYTEKPNAVGDRKLDIEITLKKADGSFETTKKIVTYSVGSSAGVTVSADGMNLFYIGIDNPVTIIGQVGDEKMKIGISQGSISRKKAGKYTVRVVEPGDCFISVRENAKEPIRFPFRVKNIPDPILKIGGLKPGPVGAAEINSQTGALAVLEDFEFDAYFTIESFKMLISGPGFPDIYQAEIKGARFTDDVYRGLKKVKKGSIITLIDVYVKGPDQKLRRLPSSSYIIK